MANHLIKIKKIYFMRLIEEQKKFEVRLNDRDYQVGDILNFLILTDDMKNDQSKIEYGDVSFKIIYVHHGLGMAENYVVLGVEAIKNETS